MILSHHLSKRSLVDAMLVVPLLLAVTGGLQAQVQNTSASVALSTNASVEQFHSLADFPEALVPTDTPTSDDNAALATAVNAWRGRSGENFSPFENFIAQKQNSRWQMALLVNLALSEQAQGYFSKAITNYTAAWNAGKGLTNHVGELWADDAFAHLLELHVAFGHVPEVTELMAEITNRPLTPRAARVVTLMQRPWSWRVIMLFPTQTVSTSASLRK